MTEHNPDEAGYKAAADAVRHAEESSDFALPDADTVARVAIDAYRELAWRKPTAEEWAQAQLDIDAAHHERDGARLAAETNCTDDYLIWRLHEEMFKRAEWEKRCRGLTRQRERAERLGAERDHHREQETILDERCEANANKLDDAVKALEESSTVILAALDRIRELERPSRDRPSQTSEAATA